MCLKDLLAFYKTEDICNWFCLPEISETFDQIKKGYELRANNDSFIVQSINKHFVDLDKYGYDLSILSFFDCYW